jgi:3-oxoacyl-[acyl-carrier-protein] synthase-1
MMSAVGAGSKPTATSVAAGVARLSETSIHDRRFRPIVMGTLLEDELPPLAPPVLEARGLTSTQQRLLRLAAPALQEAVADFGNHARLPLFLGTPEATAGRPAPVDARWLDLLAKQSDVPFDVARSKSWANGRAAGLFALAGGMRALASGAVEHVLVGAVDTYVDLMRIADVDRQGRVLAEGVMDGFVPGEGACFLLLSSAGVRGGGPAIARIEAVATASEPGHRFSEEPYRGDGLAGAFQAVFAQAENAPPVRCVWAGLNGESFNAKEWGTAYARSRERFAEPLKIEHPVDCFGDPGAALGLLMLGIAAAGIADGKVEEPALVWCSSDGEERAAALVRRAG